MRKVLMIFAVLMTITGCRFSFEIEETGLEKEICIRSMICADSTATILMHKAVPITDVARVDTAMVTPVLTLKCNGQEVGTASSGAENGGRRFKADAFKEGDKLELTAGAEGMETVMASTVVPGFFTGYEIGEFEITSGLVDKYRIVISYEDDPETDDFYGVSVEQTALIQDPDWEEPIEDSFHLYPGEGYDELTLDPGAYSPTVSEIEGQTVFIWKDEDEDGSYEVRFQGSYAHPYCVEIRTRFCFYKLSEELYKTLKADFEAGYNPLFYIGLATPSFTYSNIRGGIGYFGAYSKTWSDWIIQKTSNE